MQGMEVLRDRSGTKIGEIHTDGSRQVLRDRYGYLDGSYDSHDDATRDKYGTIVVKGNLLATLLT
jgi:hypothetical protein